MFRRTPERFSAFACLPTALRLGDRYGACDGRFHAAQARAPDITAADFAASFILSFVGNIVVVPSAHRAST